MKKILISVLISAFIIPSIAQAYWWNPFTWNLWKTMPWNNKQTIQTITATTTTKVATTTATSTTKNNIVTKKIIKKEPIAKIPTQIEIPQTHTEANIPTTTIAPTVTVITPVTTVVPTPIETPVIQTIIVPTVITPAPVPAPVPTINIGLIGSYPSNIDRQNSATLWNASLTINNGPVTLSNLKLIAVGTMSTEDIKNFSLFIDGNQYGTTIDQLGANNQIDFINTITLTSGNHDIKLIGDIIGLSERWFTFTLRSNEGITTMDSLGNIIRPLGLPVTTSKQTIN